MLAEQRQDRSLALLLALGDLGEDRALLDGATHDEADDDQHEAEQERDAPAPLEECVAGRDDAGHQREGAGGEQEADRNTDLRECSHSTALVIRRVLDGHQHGATPLTTGGEALQDPQEQQQHRREDTDLFVGRQHTDQHRG